MNETDLQAVRDVLQQFQDGYERRDLAFLDDFCKLFADEDGVEVIGTSAVFEDDDDWCLGIEAVQGMVSNDWIGWGDLVLEVAGAKIHILGDVAWLATTATVTMALDPKETYQDYLDYIHEEVTGNEDMPARDRVLEILRGGTNTLFEAEKGEKYVWPLRFTAVLVRRDSDWRFHQTHFSFSTTRFPDVRNL